MTKSFILGSLLFVVYFVQAQNKICFQVSDVVADTNKIDKVTYDQAIRAYLGNGIESIGPCMNSSEMIECEMHPFVYTLHLAFGGHKSLEISPDMIWLLICQGFAAHVDQKSDSLRHLFVSFESKVSISIKRDHFVKGQQNSWENTFPEFCDGIKKYIGSEVNDLIVAKFSTTGIAETSAFQVSLMDAMDNYFEYDNSTDCGIPSISLSGTTQDWEWIRTNVLKLNKYGLEWWTKELVPILNQFVNASKGKIDKIFWESLYKYHRISGDKFVTGWILKLFPYVLKSKRYTKNWLMNAPLDVEYGLDLTSFPCGYSKVDFIWNYFSMVYNMEFIAGFMGIVQDKNGLLVPEINWAVKEKAK